MPPLKKGALPTYRLHKPTGKAVITIGARDHYLGVHDSSKSKAEYVPLISEYSLTGETQSTSSDAEEITVIEVPRSFGSTASASE